MKLVVMVAYVALLFAGCRGESVEGTFSVELEDNQKFDARNQGGSDGTDLRRADEAVDPVEWAAKARKQLDDRIDKFPDETEWTFGAREDGLPVGKWVSEDEDRAPVIFAADGTFQCHFTWSRGAGSMADGYYAISSNGVIVGVAKSGEVNLGVHYRLQDGVLYGPKGPLPKVAYRKVDLPDDH